VTSGEAPSQGGLTGLINVFTKPLKSLFGAVTNDMEKATATTTTTTTTKATTRDKVAADTQTATTSGKTITSTPTTTTQTAAPLGKPQEGGRMQGMTHLSTAHQSPSHDKKLQVMHTSMEGEMISVLINQAHCYVVCLYTRSRVRKM